MTRFLFNITFLIGALAIIWIGKIFLGTDAFGLAITVLIGAVYLIGTYELVIFRRASAGLSQALDELEQPVSDLNGWLSGIDAALVNPVRQRVFGAHNPLPAPVITPYLVGLLVMLGLLGTFIGMIDTLKGAVSALEGSSELEAIRAGLASPIEGLGLAFGTSVAGVAASAMLGLLSTISRRERIGCSHRLDEKIANHMQQFGLAHQQKAAFNAIEAQANSLPEVAQTLATLATNLEGLGDRIGADLLASQQKFQDTATDLFKDLHTSVDTSLKNTISETAELINSRIQPLAEQTLKHIDASADSTQQRLVSVSEQYLSKVSDVAEANAQQARESVVASLEKQGEASGQIVDSIHKSIETAVAGLQSSSDELLKSFASNSDQWLQQQQEQALKFEAGLSDEMLRLREDEQQRGLAAVDRLSELEETVAEHIASLGKEFETPMTKLIEVASQTPVAAAQVIEKLREEMTKSLQRENDMLEERAKLLKQFDNVSASISTNSEEQRKAIDSLVERSASTLTDLSSRFDEQLQGESERLAEMMEHFASNSAEMASMGEAFTAAVSLFSESNTALIENLTRIEDSLEKSSSRSDEQLAYYVAQAREIIDLNLLSQKQIIDALQNTAKPVTQKVGA